MIGQYKFIITLCIRQQKVKNVKIILGKFYNYFVLEKNDAYVHYILFLWERKIDQTIYSYVTDLTDLTYNLIKDKLILIIWTMTIKNHWLTIKDLILNQTLDVWRVTDKTWNRYQKQKKISSFLSETKLRIYIKNKKK